MTAEFAATVLNIWW